MEKVLQQWMDFFLSYVTGYVNLPVVDISNKQFVEKW